ncbi:MAG: ROK family protein [Firmicutes bacterium]|nr:ROK family protein [Bacillota bacterium]
MNTYLCFDFGGTFIKYAVIAKDESILVQDKFPTVCDDHEAFMANIRRVYEEYPDVKGIGISMAGVVDTDTGFAYTGGAITCLAQRNIVSEISALCGELPVSIENDAKAAAYAELSSGALKDCRNGVVIVIGTALGGTVIADRKILRGKNLFAGELSYVYYNNEAMMDRKFGELPRKHDKEGTGLFTDRCTPKRICQLYSALSGEQVDVTDCPVVFERAENGDEHALWSIRSVARDLAMLAFNLQCVVDPDVIAIGGGISSDPMFIQFVKEEIREFADHIVPGAPIPEVTVCKYGSSANLIGAFYSHRDRFFGNF